MRSYFLLICLLFCPVLCFSQSEEIPDHGDMQQNELHLGVIQGFLSTFGHNNPFDYQDEEALYSAYELAKDSLQNLFYTSLEKICVSDTKMEYEFSGLGRWLSVAVSPDKMIRVFSRDTYRGGTMPYLCSYIQYMSDDRSYFGYMPGMDSKDDYVFGDYTDYGLFYDNIYRFTDGEKVYYLLTGMSQIASFTPVFVLRAVSVANGRVRCENIFLTPEGPASYIMVSYRPGNDPIDQPETYIGESNYPRVVFDSHSRWVLVPEVVFDDQWSYGRLTGQTMIMQWENGLFRQSGFWP